MRYLYQTDKTEVKIVPGTTDYLVISFSNLFEPPPPDFFGVKYFLKRDINAIAIRVLENNWWMSRDVELAIRAVENYLAAKSYKGIVGYGASMGSFGTVLFSDRLGFQKIILMGTIVSVDPKMERRWYSYIERIKPSDLIYPMTPTKFPENMVSYCIFDPLSPDKKHVDYLSQRMETVRIFIPEIGHLVPQFLLSGGILTKVVDELLTDNPSLPDIQEYVRQARSRSWRYVLSQAKNNYADTDRFFDLCKEANVLAPDQFQTIFMLSQAYSKKRKLEEAFQLIAGYKSPENRKYLTNDFAEAAVEFIKNGGKKEMVEPFFQLFFSPADRSRQAQLGFSRYLRITGRYQEAFKAHEQFLGNDTFSGNAFFERGLIYDALGKPEKALEQYRLAYKASPDRPLFKSVVDKREKAFFKLFISKGVRYLRSAKKRLVVGYWKYIKT